MFDDNGEPYRRRVTDRGGEDEYAGPHHRREGEGGWIKLAPMLSGIAVVLFGWGVSVESRVGTIQTIQAERTIKITGIETHLSEVAKAAYDPSPKPEAKVMIDQLEIDHTRMDGRLNRLEERFNNFHQFILQVMPKQMVVPPSKRGSMPFSLEGERG